MIDTWMIYGANGYTGELIARAAAKRGLKPILAGRSTEKIKPLAEELELEARIFSLDKPETVKQALKDISLVLHCAGPFSKTSAPMLEGCIAAKTHYLDITGEISVMEHAHHPDQAKRAKGAGVVLCPGVGFDVIPTDCVASKLKELLPDATSLSLGFHSGSKVSPGTVKTMIEGLGSGSLKRINGKITKSELGKDRREIDFGQGTRSAISIPWGDVSTAYYTTGIPNIDTWVPMPEFLITATSFLDIIQPIMDKPAVKTALKKLADQFISGPDEETRKKQPTFIWGEAKNSHGVIKTVRIQTANVYTVTIEGALASVQYLLEKQPEGGSYTPAVLFGSELVEELSGSWTFQVEES